MKDLTDHQLLWLWQWHNMGVEDYDITNKDYQKEIDDLGDILTKEVINRFGSTEQAGRIINDLSDTMGHSH